MTRVFSASRALSGANSLPVVCDREIYPKWSSTATFSQHLQSWDVHRDAVQSCISVRSEKHLSLYGFCTFYKANTFNVSSTVLICCCENKRKTGEKLIVLTAVSCWWAKTNTYLRLGEKSASVRLRPASVFLMKNTIFKVWKQTCSWMLFWSYVDHTESWFSPKPWSKIEA